MLDLLAQATSTLTSTNATAAGVGQVVALILAIVLAVLAYKKAKSNNSDKAILWAVVCFLLGLIGYAIFYFVEAKNYNK